MHHALKRGHVTSATEGAFKMMRLSRWWTAALPKLRCHSGLRCDV